jgi:hypothetical protein
VPVPNSSWKSTPTLRWRNLVARKLGGEELGGEGESRAGNASRAEERGWDSGASRVEGSRRGSGASWAEDSLVGAA